MAGSTGVPDRPANWDKHLAVALLRIIGLSQAEAARAAAVGERTVRRWEASELWPVARAEARERWFDDAGDVARGALSRAMRLGNVQAALWFLERTDPRLAPPKVQMELAGKDGGPVLHEHGLVLEVIDAQDEPDSADPRNQHAEREG